MFELLIGDIYARMILISNKTFFCVSFFPFFQISIFQSILLGSIEYLMNLFLDNPKSRCSFSNATKYEMIKTATIKTRSQLAIALNGGFTGQNLDVSLQKEKKMVCFSFRIDTKIFILFFYFFPDGSISHIY